MIFFFPAWLRIVGLLDCTKNAHTQVLCGAKKVPTATVSLLKIARKFGIYWDAPPPTKSVPKLQIGITSTTKLTRNLGFAGWHWNPGSGNISTDSMILLAVSKAHWVGLALELRSVVWFIIHERSQLHPKTYPCSVCESSLPIIEDEWKTHCTFSISIFEGS